MSSKIILITGISSGFGFAMAKAFCERGHIVYGTSRYARAENLPAAVRWLALDVTNGASVEQAVAAVYAAEKRIDVVVNNAGMGICGAAELATDEEIALQMNTNFMGVVRVCRAVLPVMRAQRSGRIINISSIGGVFAVPYQGLYSASKFAVEGYSEALSLETKAFGVDIVLVEPGDFNTGFTAGRRISERTASNTDYQKAFAKTLAIIEQDERMGGSPDYLAKKMVRIVEKKYPRLRYVVAKSLLQRLSVMLSRFIPDRWFEKILRLFYSMN
jgi:NAD(P)-dependent dehydrogenase (short-subunit alcohol dehydrogenase family)